MIWIFRTFPIPKVLRYSQNSQCVQNSIFPSENMFFPILWKILKLEVMEYLIHYILSLKWEIILFSAVKHRLGNRFSQFLHRFKIGIFWVLVLSCNSKFIQLTRRYWDIFECCSCLSFQFLPIYEKDEKNGGFEFKARLYLLFISWSASVLATSLDRSGPH